MQHLDSFQSEIALGVPEILCRPLEAFDDTNLENVRLAFQSVVPCLLGQAWLDENQAGFSPATVRAG